MLTTEVKRQHQTPSYPADVHPLVSELFQTDRRSAEMQIWRDLRGKEGAVWHRQSDPELRAISERLLASSSKLFDREMSHAIVSGEDDLENALRKTVGDSQLVTRELLLPEQTRYLEAEYRWMYGVICRLTGGSEAAIDLRIERSKPFIDNFHQDLGTALLMTLVGPGTHFIKPDNKPVGDPKAFFREEIPRPQEVFEVPTCSLLAMRGKPGVEASPLGLWHSSPPKTWNNQIQWDARVLLIVTSPLSTILPPPPILATPPTLAI